MDNVTDREKMFDALSRYTWGYDSGDSDLMAEAFTPDATSGGVVTGTDISWGPMRGRDEIVSTLSSIRDTQTDRRRHGVANFIIVRQTETEATMRAYLNLLGTENGVTRVITGGEYEADFVKDGEIWRMSRLDGVLDAPF